MDEGWVIVLVAAISGGAGVAGSLLAGRQAIRARRADRTDEQARRLWEAKRDAYQRLLTAVQHVESVVDGALAAGSGPIKDRALTREILAAEIEARLYAPTDVWERIAPTVRAVSYKSHALGRGNSAAEAVRRLRELGANEAEGSERLHEDALEAIREDLASS